MRKAQSIADLRRPERRLRQIMKLDREHQDAAAKRAETCFGVSDVEARKNYRKHLGEGDNGRI